MKSRRNKTAIALHYDGKNTPRVTAKGHGLIGEKIIQLAQEHGIPIHKDAGLATALASIPLDDEIPYELYVGVAQVLAFIYYLEDKQAIT